MPRFNAYNYDQNAMMVISYQDQLQPSTFEHAVHYLIEHKLDLSFLPSCLRSSCFTISKALSPDARCRGA